MELLKLVWSARREEGQLRKVTRSAAVGLGGDLASIVLGTTVLGCVDELGSTSDICNGDARVQIAAHRAIDNSATIVFDDANPEGGCPGPTLQRPSLIAHPIFVKGVAIGAFCVTDPDPERYEDDPELLSDLARVAGDEITRIWQAGRDQAPDRTNPGEDALRDATLETLDDGILLFETTDGGIIETNIAAQRMLGLRDEDLFGRTPTDPRWAAVHPDGTEFGANRFPMTVTLREGTPFDDVPMGFRRGDGQLCWAAVSTRRVDDPRHGEVVQATLSDISELRRAANNRRARTALHDASRHLASLRVGGTTDDVCHAAADYATRALEAGTSCILRYEHPDELVVVGDCDPGFEHGHRISLDDAPALGDLLELPNATFVSAPDDADDTAGLSIAMAAPIDVDRERWGLLTIGKPHPMDPSEIRERLERVEMYAALIGLALSREVPADTPG